MFSEIFSLSINKSLSFIYDYSPANSNFFTGQKILLQSSLKTIFFQICIFILSNFPKYSFFCLRKIIMYLYNMIHFLKTNNITCLW